MRLVVDANILVAAFLKASVTRELLLDGRLDLYAPEHLLVETRQVLTKRSALRRIGITASQLGELFACLTSPIRMVAEEEYAHRLGKAIELAPHAEDAPYLAVALTLRAPVWSNDAILKEQGQVRVYTTRELLTELSPR